MTEHNYAEELFSLKEFIESFMRGITEVELAEDLSSHLFSPDTVKRLHLLIPHLEVTLPAEVERNFLKNGTPN